MFIIKIFIEIQKFKLLLEKKSIDKSIMVSINVFWQNLPILSEQALLRLTSLPVLVFVEFDLQN